MTRKYRGPLEAAAHSRRKKPKAAAAAEEAKGDVNWVPVERVFPGNQNGPMFRGKRVALGLSVQDMMATVHLRLRWHRFEDGEGIPPGGWPFWFARLFAVLQRRVQAHVSAGGNPLDFRCNPWSTAEILAASRVSDKPTVEDW